MMIRKVELSELDNVIALGRLFFAESSVFTAPLNPASFKATWTQIYASGMGTIIGLYDGDTLCGGIGAMSVPDYLTGEMVANEFFLYVAKKYRGKGIRIIREYERWAKEKGCVKTRLVHLVDSMPDKLRSFYAKIGYREIETLHEKRLI